MKNRSSSRRQLCLIAIGAGFVIAASVWWMNSSPEEFELKRGPDAAHQVSPKARRTSGVVRADKRATNESSDLASEDQAVGLSAAFSVDLSNLSSTPIQRLWPHSYEIVGHVRDERGHPIKGASIWLHGGAFSRSRIYRGAPHTTTDASGAYRVGLMSPLSAASGLSFIPRSHHLIEACAPGYELELLSIDEDPKASVDFALASTPHHAFTVTTDHRVNPDAIFLRFESSAPAHSLFICNRQSSGDPQRSEVNCFHVATNLGEDARSLSIYFLSPFGTAEPILIRSMDLAGQAPHHHHVIDLRSDIDLVTIAATDSKGSPIEAFIEIEEMSPLALPVMFPRSAWPAKSFRVSADGYLDRAFSNALPTSSIVMEKAKEIEIRLRWRTEEGFSLDGRTARIFSDVHSKGRARSMAAVIKKDRFILPFWASQSLQIGVEVRDPRTTSGKTFVGIGSFFVDEAAVRTGIVVDLDRSENIFHRAITRFLSSTGGGWGFVFRDPDAPKHEPSECEFRAPVPVSTEGR